MAYSLAPHVTATATDDGLVLLDEDAGRYWQMNGTGALVLRSLIEGGTIESVTAVLCRRFPGVPPEKAAADVQNVVAALRAAKMVTS